VTTALLAHDPDVQAINGQIAVLMGDRIKAAFGDLLPPEAHVPLFFMLTGGLLNAGMGFVEYRDVTAEMVRFADALPLKKKR
jgi:hypothetical protein